MSWVVEVVSHETGKVVHTVPGGDNERRADKVSGGIDANLNHDQYFTRVVEKKS